MLYLLETVCFANQKSILFNQKPECGVLKVQIWISSFNGFAMLKQNLVQNTTYALPIPRFPKFQKRFMTTQQGTTALYNLKFFKLRLSII